MRGLRRMVLSGVVVGVLAATGAADGAPPPTGSRSTAAPVEVHGGVEVRLGDGDRFRVWHSGDLRTVWGRRYDAATGAWGERSVVLRKRHLYCGDVDARAAGDAVAVIAECERGSWAEDQAPTASQALYSPDTLTWASRRLEGEAYEEPGISPGGTAAIWPQDAGYVTWTAGTGFAAHRLDLPGQEYTLTATIGDDGGVSVLYGATDSRGRHCTLAALSRTGDGPVARQDLPVPEACGDVDLRNLDALTVQLGDPSSPETLTTVTRPDTSSPWAVTGVAPARAPGLVRHGGRGSVTTRFLHATDLPLVAIGSADGRTFDTQVYDAAAQRWEPARQVRLGRTCHWGDEVWMPLGVLAPRLRCDGRDQVLVSTDARSWRTARLGGHPLGVSPDRRFVAVTTARRTLVFSQERGAVRLPLGATRRCDVVVPTAADAVVRLTTARPDGWPTVLQVSDGGRWRRTATAVPDARVGDDTCRRAEVDLYDERPAYGLSGRRRVVTYAVRPRGAGWKVTRVRW